MSIPKPALKIKRSKIEVLFKTDSKSNVLGTYKVEYTGKNLQLKIDGNFMFISFTEDDSANYITKVFNLNEISAIKEFFDEK